MAFRIQAESRSAWILLLGRVVFGGAPQQLSIGRGGPRLRGMQSLDDRAHCAVYL
jgi:hypothetical protein